MLANRRGAVVALDPTHRRDPRRRVSSPSYDPSTLSSHNTTAIQKSWQTLNNDKTQPMLNRALNQSYPPGSIFKVVVAAAALKAGKRPRSHPGPGRAAAARTATATMHNFNGERCGNGKTDTLDHAFTNSCNTAFAQLCIDLGQGPLGAEAELFGMNNQPRTVPLDVARSTIG